jgi:UDP-glucose 4-epimerase
VSRYLVTGGSGRLGRSVVAVLADAGHEVISIDRSPHPSLSVEQRQLDLLDAAATAELFTELRPDGVVHLAAIAVPFEMPAPELYAINTALAFSVLEATLASGTGSLLLTSSPTVIGYGAPTGWKPEYLPIDEKHPTAPWNGYSLSKQAVESIAAMAARAYGDRLAVGVFRPCYVIAPEEWLGAPTQQGHTVAERLASPELSAVALFNYVDARDAGEFVLTWLQKCATIANGGVFFVGAADTLSDVDSPELVARFLPAASEFIARLGASSALFSSDRARRELGWTPRRSWRTELTKETSGG